MISLNKIILLPDEFGNIRQFTLSPVTAARSHPELNPKISTNEAVGKWFELDKKENFPTYYITFTDIDKAGINPSFDYENPIGVFCYPIRSVFSKGKLDVYFAGNRKYIQVLKLNVPENKVLWYKIYKRQRYVEDIKTLRKIFDALFKGKISAQNEAFMFKKLEDFAYADRNKVLTEIKNQKGSITFDQLLALSRETVEAKQGNSNGEGMNGTAQIWYLTQAMACLWGNKFQVKWNILLQKVGYEVIEYPTIDFGNTYISPTQTDFLSSRSYQHVDSIKNSPSSTFSLSKNTSPSMIKNILKKVKDGYEIMGNLVVEDQATMDELPDSLIVTGSFKINNGNVTKLPNHLVVKEDLDISHSGITELPDNLKVGGKLNLASTSITKLSPNLEVGESLILSNSHVISLPEDLKVGGSLDINYSQVENIPNTLKVINGNLEMASAKVSKLPDTLEVKGNVDMNRCRVTELPSKFSVGGNLSMQYSWVKKLPENLKVGGNLDVKNSRVTELPSHMQIGNNIDLSQTSIDKLPNGLIVNGNLILENTPITSLPDDLVVKGFLNIKRTKIKDIPASAKIGQVIQ